MCEEGDIQVCVSDSDPSQEHGGAGEGVVTVVVGWETP